MPKIDPEQTSSEVEARTDSKKTDLQPRVAFFGWLIYGGKIKFHKKVVL
jgi:hypothetical protein